MLTPAEAASGTAYLDAVDVDAETVTVQVHLRIPQTRVDDRPDLEAVLHLSETSAPATWVARPDRGAKYGAWCALRVEIPTAQWPRGIVRPVLEVTRQRLPLRPTRSLFRTCTPGVRGDVAIDVRAGGNQAVVELVDGGERAARRLALRSDLRAVRHRQPLWGWRLVRAATAWMHRSPLWLVGERRDTAQDNGAALFRHLRTERRDVRAYYVVEKGTEAWRRMKPLGRVVAADGWRHKLLTWHASHLVNAFDPDVYGVPRSWRRDDYVRHVRPRVGTRRVFLQHGVVYRDLSAVIGRLVAGYDLVLTSAAREREWIADRLGYGDRAVLSGLPRHDLLVREPDGVRVLFAPTWRADLVVPSYREEQAGAVAAVEHSEYARLVRAVVSDERLLAALERHDAVLEVLPHYEARDVLAALVLDQPRVRLIDQEREEFAAVLRRASVFLTDYSSTLFDAALLGVPVVAAHVDPAFEQAGRPQAFDVDEIGIAQVTRTVPDAVTAVVAALDAGGVQDRATVNAVDDFFAYSHPSGNAERAVAAIEAMTVTSSARTPE